MRTTSGLGLVTWLCTGPMVPTMGIMVGGGTKRDLLGFGFFFARWIFSSLKGDFTLPKLFSWGVA